jgi:hypothetical protein
MSRAAALYFHFPCFDGTISGVLAKGFLESQGWEFGQVHPVNYELRGTWLSSRLESPCAVVDFLYHPDAQFWADHHLTTFLTPEAQEDFARRSGQWMFYNSDSGSCASLLWTELSGSYERGEAARLQEMVRWAEKIDSARYDSVEEAILGDAPALRISFSLMRRADAAYSRFLLEKLSKGSLDEVAKLSEVVERFEEARGLLRGGLARLESSIRLVDGGIAVFDVEAKAGSMISRYAPFYFFPRARYSVGIVRYERGARITAMRNPWFEFPSVPLGPIFERLGGGGHQRVGALILPKDRANGAGGILEKVVSEIRQREAAVSAPARGG